MKESKQKLVEGKKYHFKVIKIMSMPGEDQEYYVLEDPYRKKHLLLAELYRNHQLIPGNKVVCRIDKINCNGKIFIEPDHPYYREGETFDFEITRFEQRMNQIGEMEEVIVVKDRFGNEVTTPVPDSGMETRNRKKVSAMVKMIKKGSIHLAVINKCIATLVEIGMIVWKYIWGKFGRKKRELYFVKVSLWSYVIVYLFGCLIIHYGTIDNKYFYI